jgi:hypothetical protein
VHFDAALAAAEMDVAPDRNGSSVTIAEAGVDTVAGNELVWGED